MKRSKINFFVDISAFAGFVLLATTGVLMRYILPPGNQGRFKEIWGLNRHTWGNIHFWIAVGFFCVLAFHLVLHWPWIRSTIAGRSQAGHGFRVALGMVGLFGLLAIAIAPLLSTVKEPFKRSAGCELCQIEGREHIRVWGAMTLKDVENNTGVPAEYILQQLGISDEVNENERLGKLRKEYGFEIEDVRRIICNYVHAD